MDQKEFLEGALALTSRAVEAKLERLLPKPEGPEARVMEAMRYAVFSGGKRLRPFLVVAASELFRVSKDSALRVAAAVECVHCYSLIHDDLPSMDDDDMRRGKPTTHMAFDEATAILAGDALLTLAFEILVHEDTHSDPRVRLELVSSLAHAAGVHGMVAGQMIDLEAEHQTLDENAVNRLQHLKTGALLCFSVEAGAILAKAAPHLRHSLVGYARDVGLAFQIVDDLLDAEGDAEEVGKEVGKDEARGKATYVSLLGVDRARDHARMLIEQAVTHLEPFDDNAALLRSLAAFVINRRN